MASTEKTRKAAEGGRAARGASEDALSLPPASVRKETRFGREVTVFKRQETGSSASAAVNPPRFPDFDWPDE